MQPLQRGPPIANPPRLFFFFSGSQLLVATDKLGYLTGLFRDREVFESFTPKEVSESRVQIASVLPTYAQSNTLINIDKRHIHGLLRRRRSRRIHEAVRPVDQLP